MDKLTAKAKLLIVLLLGVMGWAFYAYINQLIYGLGVTGMNRPMFWGLYIVNFVFLIGVSAGGIAVASLSHLGGIEKFKPVGRIAELVAIISLILAMLSILFDLGRPDRLLNLFIFAKPLSPLVWDVIVINIYLVLCVLLLWSSLKNKPNIAKIFAYISIPAFVLVHSITAWIFGLIKSQSGWHTAILAPIFICSALVSGLSLIILAILFVRWMLKIDIGDDTIVGLGKYFKILLPVLFYFLFCEFLTIGYAELPSHLAVLKELLVGKFSSIFWFDMIFGIVIPFILVISPTGKTVSGITFVSIFSLLGVFAERVNIVLPSLYHPSLITSLISYSPTWIEFSLLAGTYAFGMLLLIIAGKIIPLKEEDKNYG